MTNQEREYLIARTKDRLQNLKDKYVNEGHTHHRSWLTKKLIEDNIFMLEILERGVDMVPFVS